MKKILPVLIIIVIAVLAFIFGKPLWNKFFSEKMIVLYSEQPVLKTDLCKYIESTGTVEPEELVNVGAQIGGMVIRFGPDTKGKSVDYGSRVKAGGILAQIDDSLYIAERDIAKANCEQGKAAIASAQASQEEAQSHYNLTKAEWERTDHLFDQVNTVKLAVWRTDQQADLADGVLPFDQYCCLLSQQSFPNVN